MCKKYGDYEQVNGAVVNDLLTKNKQIEHLKILAETDFMGACVWAENNIDSLKSFFDTWAKHCGAARATFVGHTVRMLIDLDT